MFCSHDKSWNLILHEVKKKNIITSVLQDERLLESRMLLWRVNWIKKVIKGDVGMEYDKADNYETMSRRRADVFTSVIRKPGQDIYSITNEIYFHTFPCLDSRGPCRHSSAKHNRTGKKQESNMSGAFGVMFGQPDVSVGFMRRGAGGAVLAHRQLLGLLVARHPAGHAEP